MKKRAADTELGGVDGLLILECFGERFRNEGTGMKCLIMKFNARAGQATVSAEKGVHQLETAALEKDLSLSMHPKMTPSGVPTTTSGLQKMAQAAPLQWEVALPPHLQGHKC